MTDSHSSRPQPTSYRQLEVWNMAMTLVVDICELSASFAPDERFRLTAQVRRAAASIPSNIAEAKARFGPGEYRGFVSLACGSAAELETELEIAERLSFVAA